MSKQEQELLLMQRIIEVYFKPQSVSEFKKFNGWYSIPDGLVVSGASDVLYELKSRPESITTYGTTMLEKSKHDGMIEVIKNLNAHHKYFFLVEWKECVLVFVIHKDQELKWELMPCQESNGSSTKVLKPVTLLPHDQAIAVITKKNDQWSVKTIDELMNYIKVVRKQYYGDEESI